MANWNNPALTSLYVDFLADLKARDVDVAVMSFAGSQTNIPVNTMRFNRATNTFQEWTGLVWQDKILSAAGGGTGTTAITLGTMAAQNSNAVAITGGTITGTALNGSDISSGIVALARGGTGASLALGPSGSFLLSSGGSVVFGLDGTQLLSLNAAAIAFNNIAMARMPIGGFWNLSGASPFVAIQGGGLILGPLANFGNGSINAQGYYLNNVAIDFSASGIPAGAMLYFSGACPAGWTFVAGSQGRTVRSINGGAGGLGGSDTHQHGFSVPAGGGSAAYNRNSGDAHGEVSGSGGPAGRDVGMDSGSGVTGWLAFTGSNGQHTHTIGHTHDFTIDAVPGFPGFNGNTGDGDSWPPFLDFSLCRKN